MSRTCTGPERGLRGSVAILLALSLGACSTQYQPRTGPRISVVMEGGSPAYARDGKTYKHGFAGSGLVEAVSDDAQAREAAETYSGRMTSGFLFSVVGTACFTAGLILSVQTIDDHERDGSKDAVIAGALLCGVAGLITGSVLLASAQPYQWDAINIYNDNLEARRPILPPTWPSGPPTPVPLGTPGTPIPLAPPPAQPPPPLGPAPSAPPTDAGAPPSP